MVAFVPVKPVTGNAIETVWGADMHNRAYTPLACVAAGNIMTGIAGAERQCSIDTFQSGYNMVDTVTDNLIIPAGGAGLYMCTATVMILNMGVSNGNFVRFRYIVNSAMQYEGAILYGIGTSSIGPNATATWYGTLNDGNSIGMSFIPHATTTADVVLRKIVLIRIGNAWGTAAARNLDEVFNPMPAPAGTQPPLLVPPTRKRGKGK